MLLLVAFKLVWSGTGLLVFYGLALIAAFAMELAGLTPYVLDVLAYALHTIKAGFLRLDDYFDSLKKTNWGISRSAILQFGLPAGAVLGFGTIFVMANPDVARFAGARLEWITDFLGDAFSRFTPRWSEFFFWIAVAWICAGLLKPVMSESLLGGWCKDPTEKESESEGPRESPLYLAYVNTLLAVIGLFLVYLTFEFQTLWFREFPAGFHYSGYAHEGAAWLTVALALATVMLSGIFRGDVLQDQRLPRLKVLAWIWSTENLLLAIAVYHRLLIYVGFNGMTRMRTVGFLGISAVVAGFVLVVRKIAREWDFVWLVRRQLWVLALAGFLYALLPVDLLVHRYNVRRILAGDPAPAVQISVHPMDSGGVLELFPLLESDNEIIREGIRAMLAQKAADFRRKASQQDEKHWTSFQWADHELAEQLRFVVSQWQTYEDPGTRRTALRVFHDYAYQWY